MVMETFLAPESWPFSVAVLLVVAIAVIEGMGLLVGLSFSGWLDDLLPDPATLENASEAWLGWLHVGKLPLLVLLVLLLTGFAMLGYTANALAKGLLGAYPPPVVSGLVAFVGTLPIVRAGGAALARIMPRDETSALPLDSLVGRVAVVINGTARHNYPAQARVRNDKGLTLYVHVEPDDPQTAFGPGDSVLLIKQISGSRFQAIANPRPDLL
jgi:YqiJ-like protein